MTEPRHADPLPLGGGGGLPYSRGLMARALMAAGVSAVRAYELAQRVQDDLTARREETVDLDRLEELAQDVLGENEGTQAIRRLRRYDSLREVEQPIIVLIGGATGTGKSTVATEVAYRLGITRVTSTDFVRQTMRAVLEGVHLVPGMLPPVEGAMVVHCVLAIEERDRHEAHFWVRDAHSEGMRPVEKYVDALDDIRALQDFIVERARSSGVPVVENTSIELAIGTVMELVLSEAERFAKV